MSTTHSSRREDSNELVALPAGRLPDEEAQIQGDQIFSIIEAAGQQQNDSHGRDPPNGMSTEEAARLWADLKAETGYASYSDYLQACQYGDRNSNLLTVPMLVLRSWRINDPDQRPELRACAIFDLSEGDNSPPELTLHCSTSSGSEVLAALRQPSAGAAIRIVLWNTSMIEEGVLDALGLGLKIHPRFFHVLLSFDKVDTRPLMPDVVVIDHHVVTMVSHYLSEYPDATPVVLIAGDNFDAVSSETQIDEMSRFRSATVKDLFDSLNKIPRWAKEYVGVLQYDLEQGRRSTGSEIDLSFQTLVPLLYSNIFKIRQECALVREKYYNSITHRATRKVALEESYKMRVMLRRIIEDSEDNFGQLQRFIRSQGILDVRQEKSSTTVEDDLKQACLEAHRLETEIRDHLQLQTGELALQESIKSIELSNLQIEEGKRVKIFTILAFVYVPLNLATSIFGMNLEQLNGSGQHLWVFIITAVITLSVTGCSWLVIEQINSYFKWRKRRFDQPYDGNTQFTLAVRLALLVFLISKGNISGMFKSGVWWRILTNHNSRISGSSDTGGLNAGEYVSKWGEDLDIPNYWNGIQWTD